MVIHIINQMSCRLSLLMVRIKYTLFTAELGISVCVGGFQEKPGDLKYYLKFSNFKI